MVEMKSTINLFYNLDEAMPLSNALFTFPTNKIFETATSSKRKHNLKKKQEDSGVRDRSFIQKEQ